MTRDRVIVVAPEHLHTAPASCQNVQLHAIVDETVVLLPIALVLTKQCGRNAVVLGRKPTGEAQGSPGLLCGVVLCKTFANEIEQGVRRHVFE
jgi:hypothetical protein